MSVKRRRGLLGDHVKVDLSDENEDVNETAAAIMGVLEYGSPAARIKRLRAHSELVDMADRMLERLRLLGGQADHALLATIASAETNALAMKVEQRRKKVSSKGGRQPRKTAVAWHQDLIRYAKTLPADRALVGKCAKRFRRSDDSVLAVLKKAGIYIPPKRKTRAE